VTGSEGLKLSYMDVIQPYLHVLSHNFRMNRICVDMKRRRMPPPETGFILPAILNTKNV
jgi:hypothetical protein